MPIHKTLLFVIALTTLSPACMWAADDPFVGTWKVNPHKAQVAGQRWEIKDLGGNKYDLLHGDIEQSFVADGADHPNKFGGTWSIKQETPDRWVVTRKHHGNVTSVSTWTLSEGGQQWIEEYKGTRPDGSTYTDSSTAARVGGGSGFVGTWELKSDTESSYSNNVIKPYGQDGLSFTWPADKTYTDMKFDGKDYPAHGPEVAAGFTSSAKRIDEHTI